MAGRRLKLDGDVDLRHQRIQAVQELVAAVVQVEVQRLAHGRELTVVHEAALEGCIAQYRRLELAAVRF